MDRNTIRNTLANNIDNTFLSLSHNIAYHGRTSHTFDFLKGRALKCIGRIHFAYEIDAIDAAERVDLVDGVNDCLDFLIAFIRANRKSDTLEQRETAQNVNASLDNFNRILNRLITALRPAPVTTTTA
jgi:hypothetical protein